MWYKLSTLFPSTFLAANCGNHKVPIHNKWQMAAVVVLWNAAHYSSFFPQKSPSFGILRASPRCTLGAGLGCGLDSGVHWGGWMTGSLQKTLTCTKMQLFPACNVAAEITEQSFPGREVWNNVSKWNYSLRKGFLWGRTECNYPSWTSARTVMFKTLPALVESATGPYNDAKEWALEFFFFFFFSVWVSHPKGRIIKWERKNYQRKS